MKRIHNTVRYIDSSNKHFKGSQKTVGSITQLRSVSDGRHPDRLQLKQREQVRRGTAYSSLTAAVFAHEVADPLTGIAASLEFIEKDLKENEISDLVLTSTLRGVRQEVARLARLLDKFRSVSGPQSLEFTSTDLRKTVEDVIAVQLIAYRAAGVTVNFHFADRLPALSLDAAKIKQVILNLCNNAVSAMPAGGCLSIKCYPSDENVILEVANNGVGISETLDGFALFKTLKGMGSGLGLTIVGQIVSAHNGMIDYLSDPDGGTKFRIAFPCCSSVS